MNSLVSKLIAFYQKIGLPVYLILSVALVIVLWGVCILGRCTPLFPITATIGLICILILVYIDKANAKKQTPLVSETDATAHHHKTNPLLTRFLDIAFVVGIIALLWLIQVTDVRTLGYFILASLVAGIIALSIFTDDTKRRLVSIIKTMVFSFLTTFAIFKYYFWVGNDGWFHTAANELIVQLGSLSPTMGKEMAFPIQHIAIAVTEIISNMDAFTATLLATALTSILITVVIYALIKPIFGERWALLGLLLFNICAHVIVWRILNIPTSHGVILALVIFLLYFLQQNAVGKTKRILQVLTIACIIVLAFTHLFSTVIVLALLTGCYIASVFSNKKLITPDFIIFLPAIVAIFGMLIITGGSGIDMVLSSIQKYAMGFTEINTISAPNLNVTDPSLLQYLLNSSTSIILIVAMIAGYIHVTRLNIVDTKVGKYLQFITIPLVIGTVSYMVTTVTFTGMAHRFQPYLSIFTVLVIIYLLVYLVHSLKALNAHYLLFIVIVVIGFSFLNLPYSEINPENPLFVSGTSADSPYAMTISDTVGVSMVLPLTNYSKKINIDIGMGRPMVYYTFNDRIDRYQKIPGSIGVTRTVEAPWLEIQNVTNEYLIFRDYLLTHPTYWYVNKGKASETTQKLQLDPWYQEKLDAVFNQRFYDNGELVWYWKE